LIVKERLLTLSSGFLSQSDPPGTKKVVLDDKQDSTGPSYSDQIRNAIIKSYGSKTSKGSQDENLIQTFEESLKKRPIKKDHKNYNKYNEGDLAKFLDEMLPEFKSGDGEAKENPEMIKSFSTDICQVNKTDPSHLVGFTVNCSLFPKKVIFVFLHFCDGPHYLALEYADESVNKSQSLKESEQSKEDKIEATSQIELLDIYWMEDSKSAKHLLLVFSLTMNDEVKKVFLGLVSFNKSFSATDVRLCNRRKAAIRKTSTTSSSPPKAKTLIKIKTQLSCSN
jgi:hypothetical protein